MKTYLKNYGTFFKENWSAFLCLLLSCICFILSYGTVQNWLIAGGVFLGMAYSDIFDYFYFRGKDK